MKLLLGNPLSKQRCILPSDQMDVLDSCRPTYFALQTNCHRDLGDLVHQKKLKIEFYMSQKKEWPSWTLPIVTARIIASILPFFPVFWLSRLHYLRSTLAISLSSVMIVFVLGLVDVSITSMSCGTPSSAPCGTSFVNKKKDTWHWPWTDNLNVLSVLTAAESGWLSTSSIDGVLHFSPVVRAQIELQFLAFTSKDLCTALRYLPPEIFPLLDKRM